MKNLRFLLFALFLGCFFPLSLVSQTQVAPFVNSHIQLFNAGAPCSGCLLDSFAAGTTTPLATYSESTGTTPNANPVVLASDGSATVYLTNASYKLRLRTAAGATLWTQDNVSWANIAATVTSLTSTGAITLTPSTAATNGANQSGPNFIYQGNFWNGSASAPDSFTCGDVLGTGTNPTATWTCTHSGSSGTASATFNFPLSLPSASISGALVAQRSLKVCDANTYAGATWDAQLTAAIADSNCGVINGYNLSFASASAATVVISNNKEVWLPCATITGGASVNPIFQVNNFGGLIGRDRNCTVITTNSGTANIIGVNNGVNWWRISDLTIQSTVARTAGAGIRVQGGNGAIERAVVNPVFDGITFDTASTSNDNLVRDVQITDGTGAPNPGSGAAWHCGIKNGGVSTGTVSGNTFDNVIISEVTAFTDAAFCIQDGSDAINILNSQAVANLGGSDSTGIHLEVVNGGFAPNGTKIVSGSFEGGLTKNAILIDSASNVSITANTIQSSLRGLLVNGGSNIMVTGNMFHLNQQEGIRITANANISIIGNQFSESSQQTTNTYSDIFGAAGLSNFNIIGNLHKDQASSGKVCKDGIEIAAGGSDFYNITGDINTSNCGTAAISDGGTGVNKNLCNPGGPCTNGPFVGSAGDISAGRSTTTGKYLFGATGNSLDYGVTTASKFTFTGGAVAGTFSVGTGTVTTAGTLIANGACQAQTGITIANALTTDAATANINAAIPATWQTGIRWFAEVQSNGSCAVILCNPTAGSITPAATSVRCTVTR